jgi:hypothetical protein
MDAVQLGRFRKNLDRLNDLDFKVKLGSILESDIRDYYASHKFDYLKEKLSTMFPDSFPSSLQHL